MPISTRFVSSLSLNIRVLTWDILQAAQQAVRGVFFLAGQVCVANSRVYVHESIAKEFVAKFKAVAETFRVGDPFGGNVLLGPLADKIQFNKVASYLEAGKASAKETALGGERSGTKGFYIKPTVFLDAPEDSKIMKEEIFGPVVVINTFKTEEEVIEKANDTEYGLSSTVYTKDLYR
jgi:aldehyde dehydrogenase (NAD+)